VFLKSDFEMHCKCDLTALETNIVVIRILDAARESARRGNSVKVSKPGD
jgi:hypothetical protein